MRKIHTIRKLTNKRGFVLLYTIFIGFILATLSTYILHLQVINKTTNYYIKNHSLKNEAAEDNKEVLFTYMNNYIKREVQPLTYDAIVNFFNTGDEFKVNYDISFIEYIKPQENYKFLENGLYFALVNEYSEDCKIEQIYKCTLEGEKIKFIYMTYGNYKPR